MQNDVFMQKKYFGIFLHKFKEVVLAKFASFNPIKHKLQYYFITTIKVESKISKTKYNVIPILN